MAHTHRAGAGEAAGTPPQQSAAPSPDERILSQAEWDEMEHQMLHEHYCGAHVCPVCGVEDPHAAPSPMVPCV